MCCATPRRSWKLPAAAVAVAVCPAAARLAAYIARLCPHDCELG